MKFGLCLVHFGAAAAPESLLSSVRAAEQAGIGLVMLSDHVVLTEDVASSYPAPFYDPLISLSYLAGVTRLELGTSVLIVPYRHPLLVARMTANLDQLSGGRLVLGVGAGWSRLEFAALGIPFQRRGAITDEYLEVIRLAWANRLLTFRGQFVDATNVETGPAPARSPHPPVWVGGSSAAAMRRAARLGDAWHPNWKTAAWLAETGLPDLQRAADEAGAAVPGFAPRIFLHVTDGRVEEEGRLAGYGSLDQVRADVDRLAGMGAEWVVFDTYGPPNSPGRAGDPYQMQQRMLERVARLIEQFRSSPSPARKEP